MVGLFRFYEREVRFYEELASSLSIAVPRCYWSAYDQGSGDFVLLLEDLGVLRAADQLAPGSAHDARLVADLLVDLHARWWNDRSLSFAASVSRDVRLPARLLVIPSPPSRSQRRSAS